MLVIMGANRPAAGTLIPRDRTSLDHHERIVMCEFSHRGIAPRLFGETHPITHLKGLCVHDGSFHLSGHQKISQTLQDVKLDLFWGKCYTPSTIFSQIYMFRWIKRPRYFIPLIILIIIVFLVIRARKDQAPAYDAVAVERGTVTQEVDVTGRVQAAESVDLAFEKSGRVARIYADVGDRVVAGNILVALDSADIQAQLLQAQANLEAEKSKLDELKEGTRPEEIQIAQTAVTTAEQDLTDAQTNLDRVTNKADADLANDYAAAIAGAGQAVSLAKNTIIAITDIQEVVFSATDQDSNRLADAKTEAVFTLLGAQNAGRWSSIYLSTLTGGAFGTVQAAVSNPTNEGIDKALSETATALQKTKLMLEAIAMKTDLTSTQKTTIETEKASINSEISTIATHLQAINVQEATNDSAITTAEASVRAAENALTSARNTLALKQAGNVETQIKAQEARVKSYEASVAQTQATLAKSALRAPVSGVVTKQETSVGEIVSANSIVVSIISDARFEIETNVPEADIAKVKINDSADVTLDAYGDDVVFQTTVTKIDPAETMIDGVATYKVTLQFTQNDDRIKPGMTANLDIKTDKRENVLCIPQRAIVQKDGQKIARVINADGSYHEVAIQTGLRGSDGLIEITEGLNEGDRIVTFLK